jgi:non-specific serine/threonine protein kinase
VGRDRAAESVRALLAQPETRLVTLTGTGGIGKTRLAIQVANDAAADFPHGVAFVTLSALTDPEQVLPALAQAIGVVGPGIHTVEERLTRLLDGQRMLVVLDNFEHVMPAAPAITALLQSTHVVTLLVTSRTPLHISGEQEFAVPPLELPGARSDTDEIARSSACALFAARCRAVRDDFSIDGTNAVTVLDICRRLGGVPLAIELAAARSKTLPPAALLRQLSRDPDVLSGGPNDHPARHQTMRGAIQWSYDLLSPSQQRLFQQLSVFAGGCTLDAAETVSGTRRIAELIEGLTTLIDAGLLYLEPQADGVPRYRMLDLIRRFGISQLEISDELDGTVTRFAAWCTDLAQQASAAFTGDGPGIWAQTLAREIDNFRSAIALFDAAGDRESVLLLATALAPLWSALGHQREGLQLLRSTLEHFDEPANPRAVMRARLVAARLATALDDFPLASAFASAASAEAMRSGDRAAEAGAHFALGNLARGVGDQDTARRHYEAALEIVRDAGDQYNTGYALVQLAKLGDLGSPDHPGNTADLATAEEYCREGLAIYQQLHNQWGIARAKNHLAYLFYKAGRYPAAVAEAAEALELFQESGNLSEGSQCVENIADVAGATGASELAARLYGMAESLQERFGTPMWPIYRVEYAQEVARVRVRLTPQQMEAAWNAGGGLSEEALIAEAIAAAQQLATAPPPSTTAPALPNGLTSREVDVLRLLATGATNPEIAGTLFISVTTVKGHVQSIMRKLDLNSRSALAAWAVRAGIAPQS